jgi:hypothetical protein
MLWQYIRLALRQLRRNPSFTLAALLSLALGIGANTAIFTLLDQVLLRPLPVPHPEQLVLLNWQGPHYAVNISGDTLSYPAYRDFRDRNQVFSGVMCRFPVPLSLAYPGRTELVDGELVSGNYFDVLGIGAAMGRVFNPQDAFPEAIRSPSSATPTGTAASIATPTLPAALSPSTVCLSPSLVPPRVASMASNSAIRPTFGSPSP